MARTDTLVQTLLAPELAAWVRARAALDGLQVSGWIRQLIVRERLRLVVEAWWRSAKQGATTTSGEEAAPFRMERLGLGDADRIEFRWLTASNTPIRDRDLAKTYAAIRASLHVGRFELRGDTRLWRVLHAFADADDNNGLRLIMEPDAPRSSTPRSK